MSTLFAPQETTRSGYIIAVLIGLDVFINALLGGRAYQTISSRIGENIRSGGWASKIPWPDVLLAHFEASIYVTEV